MDNLSLSDLTINDRFDLAVEERKSFLRLCADQAGYEGAPLSEVPQFTIIPSEIRTLVYDYLSGSQKVRVDLTTSRGATFQLRWGLPDLFYGDLKNLLQVGNETLYNEVTYFIRQNITYFNENGDTLERFPQILGRDCSLILRLEVRLNNRTKCKHRYFWPRFLAALLALRNLEHLRLYSTSEPGRVPYRSNDSGDPDGTVTKHQQEMRSWRLLGSFVIHRHHNLDIMVQPARAQPNFVDEQGRFVHEFVLHKYNEDRPIKLNKVERFVFNEDVFGRPIRNEAPRKETLEDHVINTTAVRRLKWTEGCVVEPTSLWIQPEVGQSKRDTTTSEKLTTDDRHFAKMDERAYQTNEVFQTRCWNLQFYDGLVEEGRREKAKAEREATRSAANASTNNAQRRSGYQGGAGQGRDARGRRAQAGRFAGARNRGGSRLFGATWRTQNAGRNNNPVCPTPGCGKRHAGGVSNCWIAHPSLRASRTNNGN